MFLFLICNLLFGVLLPALAWKVPRYTCSDHMAHQSWPPGHSEFAAKTKAIDRYLLLTSQGAGAVRTQAGCAWPVSIESKLEAYVLLQEDYARIRDCQTCPTAMPSPTSALVVSGPRKTNTKQQWLELGGRTNAESQDTLPEPPGLPQLEASAHLVQHGRSRSAHCFCVPASKQSKRKMRLALSSGTVATSCTSYFPCLQGRFVTT